FMPHMHVRGKDFKYTLVLPDGSSKVLLNVPKYDFNWQLNYWLKAPVAAPKGSRLECVAHHDNSTNNKYNPDPTKTVYWGDQTWEEMMIAWFDYTVDSEDLRKETALLK
ncbi:MAG: thiol-disulfide isomerase, partial [Blastocatellia bacterium]